MNKNRNAILGISAVIGAIVGVAAGMSLLKRVEENEERPLMTTREGVSLGMLVMGLLRQIALLGDDED